MTQVKTYAMVNVVEDIDANISNISPTETPFQSMIGREKSEDTTFKWLEDRLRAGAKNAKLEGAAAASTARDVQEWREGFTQILSETIEISGTSQAVKRHGIANTLAYELAKTGKVLKQDLEVSLVGNAQAGTIGSSVAARELKSYQAQIHADTTLDAGTAASLTEAMIVALQAKLYTAGVAPSTLMIKPTDSEKVAAFGLTSTRTRELGQGKKIVNAIDVLVTPYGEVKTVLNRHLKADNALLFDADSWKLVTLRGWTKEPLAKTGDSTSVMVIGEFGLKHVNYKASGIITDLA
jgi:hypothetical protein